MRAVEVKVDGFHGGEDGVSLRPVVVGHDETAVGVGGGEEEEEVECYCEGSEHLEIEKEGSWR